jgi:pyruvate dehydrogenase (quinone)
VPPLPPHITFEQAKALASATLRGDVDALGYLKQSVKEVAASILPSPKK